MNEPALVKQLVVVVAPLLIIICVLFAENLLRWFRFRPEEKYCLLGGAICRGNSPRAHSIKLRKLLRGEKGAKGSGSVERRRRTSKYANWNFKNTAILLKPSASTPHLQLLPPHFRHPPSSTQPPHHPRHILLYVYTDIYLTVVTPTDNSELSFRETTFK